MTIRVQFLNQLLSYRPHRRFSGAGVATILTPSGRL